MSKNHVSRMAQGVLLLVALLFTSPLWAQDEDFVAEGDDSLISGEGQIDFSSIDDLLEQDEAVLSNDSEAIGYDPGARRDPFRSLIVRLTNDEEPTGDRPDGAGGLMIDELQIQGIFVLDDGPVAQVVSASEETSFLLRPGDQLWDGDVVSINLEEIVFKQSVNDPTALKPFREIVKRLNP